MKGYIAIDNGVSGSIAGVTEGYSDMHATPTFKEQNYTKSKSRITRVDFQQLHEILYGYGFLENRIVLIERPFVNPRGFKATVSAMRALEATLIAIELVRYPYQYVDSREWQKVMLPGVKGTTELKLASKDVGIRLFPDLRHIIEKHKDADSLLMAEWARRSGL